MVKIPVVSREVTEIDEAGNPVIKTVIEPAAPFPPSMIKVVCDGAFYTVYEAGDVMP